MTMTNAIWLARCLDQAGARTYLRCRTAGEAPGPSSPWQPIADPFADQGPGSDDHLWTVADRAPALGDAAPLGARRLLPPCAPQKIFGIGRNYRDHAKEMGGEVPSTPLTFLKAPSCLIASGDALELPRGYARIDMESELVVVIGQRGRRIGAAQAWDHVGGYLLGNDVSCRDLQQRDGQWTRAKGFDGFGPISAFLRLTPPGWELPVDRLELCGLLDDVPVQRERLSAMVFSIPALIEHLSAGMTLERGDLIFTGTPAGVSALAPGSVVRVQLRGLELGPLVTPIH